MAFDDVWRELRTACRDLGDDEVLVTPATERAFAVEAVDRDRVTVRFVDDDAERSLWRDQFAVLAERLADGEAVDLVDLPPGVEPYAAVLSLAGRYAVADGALREAAAGESGSSPFRRESWEVRPAPERVRDDAVLLADLLGRLDPTDPDSLDTDDLVDLYVVLSDVQRGADRVRRDVGDALLGRIGPDGRLSARFGTVTRTTRERRRPKDDEVVFDALDERGIPREWVVGVDPEKLDVVLAVTDLDPEAVYDVTDQVYAQKTGVAEEGKRARLEGLRDRLADLEGEEAEELREEVAELEDRLDALLAAG